jgi:hypothetical protein
MSEKPISPLRRRMIEDMTVRNFVEKTHNNYIRHVRTFTAFLGRAPDTAAPEDLRLFQCSAAFLLHRDARPPRDGKAPHVRAGAAQDAGGLEPGGDRTAAGGGPRAEVQGRAERRLWRRTQCFPRGCWSYCAIGIASPGPRSGCSRAVIRCCRRARLETSRRMLWSRCVLGSLRTTPLCHAAGHPAPACPGDRRLGFGQRNSTRLRSTHPHPPMI